MKDYQTHPESGGSCADQRSGNRPAKTRTVREARSAFEHAGAEVARATAPVNQATSVMTSDTGPANRVPQPLGPWQGEIIKTGSLEAREGPSLDQGDRL